MRPMHSRYRGPEGLFATILMLAARATAALGGDAERLDEVLAAEAFTAEPAALFAAAETLAVDEDASVQVLLREASYRFEDDGRRIAVHRSIYRILSPAAIEGWSTLAAAWRPWHQDRPELKARVLLPGGGEHRLDPTTIDDSPVGDEADILSDRRKLQAPLPAVAAGALVETRVVIRDRRPFFAWGTVVSFGFANFVPVERIRLEIDAPGSLPLHVTTRRLDGVVPRRTETAGRVRLEYTTGPVDALEDLEAYVPGEVVQWPLVAFSTGVSWAEVAQRYSDLVDEQLAGAELDELVRELVDDADDRHETASRLLDWLHAEIRYTGLEFGEGAFVPRTPAETLERRYGDCKDKAALLVAMLRAAGIPAHLALLATGPGVDVLPEVPGMGGFDHAIVVAPGDEDLWIDPTHEFAGVGELPGVDQGRRALIAAPGTTELVTIPAAASSENRSLEVREVYFDRRLEGARVVKTSRSWGSFSRHYRRGYQDLDPSAIEDDAKAYMESFYGTDELLAVEISDLHDLDQPFEIRIEADGSSFAVTSLDEASVTLPALEVLGRLPDLVFEEEAGDDADGEADGEDGAITGRTHDLVLPEPYQMELEYRLIPPAGYRPAETPESAVHQLGPSRYEREARVADDGVVHLILRFDTGPGRLTPEELEALRAGVRELSEDPLQANLVVRFENVGAVLMAAGQVREALEEYRRGVELEPEDAVARMRLAFGLLEAGLGEAARSEARRAVELEPELYLAYQGLGWILQHDLLGRLRRPGFDHQGAADAYRQAGELEADDLVSRQNLAILLEHDSGGARWTSEADLEAALATYDELEELGNDRLATNRLLALAHLRRFDEMLERVRRQEAPDGGLLLTAIAASKGSDAARREARRLGVSGQQATRAAANYLLSLRMYTPAAEMLGAATRGAENPAQLVQLAELLRRVERHEDIEHDDTDPRSVVRRLMIAALLGQVEDFEGLLSSRLDKAEGQDADLSAELGLRRQAVRQEGLAFESVVDLGLAAMELVAEGDDETGFRVRARVGFGEVSETVDLFVVREAGGYRLLTALQDFTLTDLGVGPLGAEVWRLVEAGETAAARRWLDWALDSLAAPAADDPFADGAFFLFWNRDVPADDLKRLRAAAASLAAAGPAAGDVVEMLAGGRTAARTAAERRPWELALATAWGTLGLHEERLELCRSWLAERPDSEAAFLQLVDTLGSLERWEEIALAARERLERFSRDSVALRVLARDAMRRGELGEALEHYRALIGHGDASSADYSNAAWSALILGRPDETTLGWAQQAVQMDASSPAALHTLASVLAEVERAGEAREILLHSLDIGGRDEPQSHDWFVLGRIAETYGVTDAAIAAYRRVERPADDTSLATSTWQVARSRLEGLVPAEDPPQVAKKRRASRRGG